MPVLTREFHLDSAKNPSKEAVIHAFSHAFDSGKWFFLDFVAQEKGGVEHKLCLQIQGLQYESGQPGWYLINGYLKFANDPAAETLQYSGFYNAINRNGIITINT